MKRICCVLLAMLPMSAFAYPIDVEKDIKGVQVDYNSHDVAYDIGNITLNNFGDVPAKCSVVFRNGPEAPRTRRVQVAPKSITEVTAKFTRDIVKLRISLSCEPL